MNATALLTTICSVKGAQTMALETLNDFFATYHHCNEYRDPRRTARDLHKAVKHCVGRANKTTWQNDPGIKLEILHRAARAWQPDNDFHNMLKRIMLMANPLPLPRTLVTPAVTYARKALEAWLRENYQPMERTHG